MAKSHKGTAPWEELEARREKYLEKPLPSSEDSERVCLGAVLLDNQLMADLAGKLKPEDFYSPLNKRVFSAMLALFEFGTQIDPITVGEKLKVEGNLESAGGTIAITNLTFGLPYFSTIDEYIDIIVEKSKARQGIRECNQIISGLLAEEESPLEVLSVGADKLDSITDDGETAEFDLVSDLVEGQVQLAHHIQESQNPITGLPTGFDELDIQTGGLQRSDLIVVGGRPSMGKTAFGLALAQNAAFRYDAFVVFFSIEMNKQQIVNRAICSEAGVNGLSFRSGLISTADWEKINEAKEFLKNGKFAIDDTPTIWPSLMKQKVRRLRKQTGQIPDLIVVDYLQLMNGNPGARYENRQQEMTKISRELKALAKSEDCPVIALSQLSRAPETRAMNNHRPMNSDLRESGAIEQDADVVLFIYREEMYPKADGSTAGHGVAEIIIGKQRNGPTGTINLYYDKHSTKFGNYAEQY